jgi:hypothetical protein
MSGIHNEMGAIRMDDNGFKHHLTGIRSQFGQAEFCLDLLSKISKSCSSRMCVEIGGNLPRTGSNSACFILADYDCHIVEANSYYTDEWTSLNLPPRIKIHNKTVEYKSDGLTSLLLDFQVELDFSILFLDIDGAEYHLLDGMSIHRPAIICVEVDNGFPLNINFVPPSIRHGMDGGQASALAMYKLLSRKGYLFLKTFGQDLVFIDAKYADILFSSGHELPVGLAAFIKSAPHGIYNPVVILVNQSDNNPTAGIDLYRKKIDLLIHNDQLTEASNLFHSLTPILNIVPSLLGGRSNHYVESLMAAITDFNRDYSSLMYGHLFLRHGN